MKIFIEEKCVFMLFWLFDKFFMEKEKNDIL